MSRRNIPFLCLASTLPLGCALGKIDADFDMDSGVSSVGGTGANQTSVGGSSSSGGSATVGGASAAGGTSSTAGSNALGGGTTVGGTASAGGNSSGTSVVGGATSVGGTANVGGTASVGGGTASVGGTSPAGGTANVGGITAVGTSSAGGTASIGGTTSAGGTANVGGITSTDGTAVAIGGTSATGGASASTGGTTAATGGTVAVTGGATSTGGTSPTGGNSTTGGVTGTGGTAVVTPLVPVQISAGSGHACALLDDGSVWCWGSNYYGQLALDPGVTSESNVPVVAKFGSRNDVATSVTAGGGHTCALLKDGTARCWGENTYGQLGDGSKTDAFKPVQVMAKAGTPLSGILAIAAGSEFTCAMVKDSSFSDPIEKCWGYGVDGELGNGRSGTSYFEAYPVNVITNTSTMAPLAGVQAISPGMYHNCAVLKDRTLRCWGFNDYGQLGDGTVKPNGLPVVVVEADGNKLFADSIAAGPNFTCALNNAVVQCWGVNGYGQLGRGTTDLSSPVPASVRLNAKAVKLAVGSDTACVIDEAGAIQCWGASTWGQLGVDPYQGTCNNSSYWCTNVPIFVSFPRASTGAQIAVGGDYITVLDAKSAIFSIGNNGYGQLGSGDGSSSYLIKPVEIYYSWRL